MSEAVERRFEAARDLARQAGARARALQSDLSQTAPLLKGAQDWVTDADVAVERFIAERLRAAFPDDGFLGEESGEAPDGGGRSGGLRWIVDPIDGTSNYARLRPRWCVSIGLFDAGQPLLGVIEAPALGECFHASSGEGATRNGERVRPSRCTDIARAMVELGWSPRSDQDQHVATAERLLRLGAMPRSEGSGALGLADVACGRSDAFIELHIQLWDVAAALAILAETDCAVDLGPLPGPIVVSSPGLGLDLARVASWGG